jgi:hypothetical protein
MTGAPVVYVSIRTSALATKGLATPDALIARTA